jgi:hypothetical protein
MTTTTSTSFASPTARHHGQAKPFAEFKAFWQYFFAKAFNPYRPELHYMRGPGPAWRAKHMAVSPAVQSMVLEIRAARARRSEARS